MTRWRQIESLFDEALTRAPSERDAFLLETCATDIELLEEVLSLLSNDDGGGSEWTWAAEAAAQLIAQTTPQISWPLSGAAVGPYTIGGLLGAGAMGQVYRARDGRLHRDVAIKVLPIEISNEESALRRVESEARALGALNHPNIAAIYDVIRDDSAAYLVLELVEGTDLAARLRNGAMPIDEAVGVAAQIADALAAAHAAGIVHRDLKPANITITPAGRVKVLDFGVSSTLDRTDENDPGAPASTSDPRVTLLAGTPAYMSPEQARGQRVDGRADLWAFGCVVYELLTGHRAFPAPKPIPPSDSGGDSGPDWSLVPLDAPRSLTAVIRSCLTHDVEQRVRSATQVQRAIETLRSLPSVASAHQPARGHEPNLRAYEAFQRAGQNSQRLVRATWEEQGAYIEECLNEAIAADPQWAAPHASLAQLYAAWAEFRSQQDHMLSRARAEAAKALELLPGEPVACAVLGTIAGVYEYDWGTAAEQFAVAATSEFVPPSVRQAYAGYYLAPLGRFTEALAQLEQAVTLDPLNMQCRGRYLLILLFAELYDRAIAEGKKQLEFDEKHIAANSMIALAHFFQGTLTDARQWAEEAVRQTPLNILAVGTLAGLLTRHGEKDRVQELDTSLRNMVPMGLGGLGMVIKHLVTSEVDAALDWYEYAVEHRQSFPAEWAAAGCLRPLRASPRWRKLAKTMKLPHSDY